HGEPLTKGKTQFGVSRVHQYVGAGLDFICPDVDVVCPGASRRYYVAAGGLVALKQQFHCIRRQLLTSRSIARANNVSFVTHHTADLETFAARQVREPPCIARSTTASRQADVYVDENFPYPGLGGGENGGRGIDGNRDACLDGRKAARIEHFVGEQEIVAQVKRLWPARACILARAVHLWALTCGRSRGPGTAAAMVLRLCSKASAS